MTAGFKANANGTQGSLQIGGVDAVVFDAAGISSGIKDGVITPSKLSGMVITQANQNTLPAPGTTITFNHGLGYIPVSAELEFVCLTAEAGYVANDVVNPANSSASYAIPPSIKRTTTLVSTTAGVGNWVVSHASTGGFVTLTAVNWAWRFKVRAA